MDWRLALLLPHILLNCCAFGLETVVQVNTKKWIYYVPERFLSMTVDPLTLVAASPLTQQSFNMAKGLSPSFVRIGGLGTNGLQFGKEFMVNSSTLTESQWDSVNDFTTRSGLDLIACLNPSLRIDGVWDSQNSLELISYSQKQGHNVAWQLGYDLRGYNATGAEIGRDLVRLRKILDGFSQYANSPVFGPDLSSVSGAKQIKFARDLLTNAGTALGSVILQPKFSNDNEIEDVEELVASMTSELDTYVWNKEIRLGKALPKKPVWIAEPTASQGSLQDAMKLAKRLGVAAKIGVQLYLKQAGVNSLKSPTPEFWFSLLYKTLVGQGVLDNKIVSQNDSSLHVFSHCTATIPQEASILDTDWNYEKGAVTVFGVNESPEPSKLTLKVTNKDEPLHIYTLTSTKSPVSDLSWATLLNGQKLTLSPTWELPVLSPKVKKASKLASVLIPGESIFFVVMPDSKVRTCSVLPLTAPDLSFMDLTKKLRLNSRKVVDDPEPVVEPEDDLEGASYVTFTKTKRQQPQINDNNRIELLGRSLVKSLLSKLAPKKPDVAVESLTDDDTPVRYITFNANSFLNKLAEGVREELIEDDELESKPNKYSALTAAVKNAEEASLDPTQSTDGNNSTRIRRSSNEDRPFDLTRKVGAPLAKATDNGDLDQAMTEPSSNAENVGSTLMAKVENPDSGSVESSEEDVDEAIKTSNLMKIIEETEKICSVSENPETVVVPAMIPKGKLEEIMLAAARSKSDPEPTSGSDSKEFRDLRRSSLQEPNKDLSGNSLPNDNRKSQPSIKDSPIVQAIAPETLPTSSETPHNEQKEIHKMLPKQESPKAGEPLTAEENTAPLVAVSVGNDAVSSSRNDYREISNKDNAESATLNSNPPIELTKGESIGHTMKVSRGVPPKPTTLESNPQIELGTEDLVEPTIKISREVPSIIADDNRPIELGNDDNVGSTVEISRGVPSVSTTLDENRRAELANEDSVGSEVEISRGVPFVSSTLEDNRQIELAEEVKVGPTIKVSREAPSETATLDGSPPIELAKEKIVGASAKVSREATPDTTLDSDAPGTISEGEVEPSTKVLRQIPKKPAPITLNPRTASLAAPLQPVAATPAGPVSPFGEPDKTPTAPLKALNPEEMLERLKTLRAKIVELRSQYVAARDKRLEEIKKQVSSARAAPAGSETEEAIKKTIKRRETELKDWFKKFDKREADDSEVRSKGDNDKSKEKSIGRLPLFTNDEGLDMDNLHEEEKRENHKRSAEVSVSTQYQTISQDQVKDVRSKLFPLDTKTHGIVYNNKIYPAKLFGLVEPSEVNDKVISLPTMEFPEDIADPVPASTELSSSSGPSEAAASPETALEFIPVVLLPPEDVVNALRAKRSTWTDIEGQFNQLRTDLFPKIKSWTKPFEDVLPWKRDLQRSSRVRRSVEDFQRTNDIRGFLPKKSRKLRTELHLPETVEPAEEPQTTTRNPQTDGYCEEIGTPTTSIIRDPFETSTKDPTSNPQTAEAEAIASVVGRQIERIFADFVGFLRGPAENAARSL